MNVVKKDSQKVGVVVLNYNSSRECRRSLSDLKKQRGVELEIVIVDNNSADSDRIAVEELALIERVAFIANDRNIGYNGGNNIGLRYIIERGCRYAMISNPDMEYPDRDYISNLLEIMNQRSDVAACAGSILTPDGTPQNPPRSSDGGGIDNFGWLFTALKSTKTKSWVEQPDVSRECCKLNGCSLLLRASSLESIGLFDKRTFLYGEESILSKQIESLGQKMYYCARSYAVHNHQKSKQGVNAFRFKHWRRSLLIYLWYYSSYSSLRKVCAYISIVLYFFVLRLKSANHENRSSKASRGF